MGGVRRNVRRVGRFLRRRRARTPVPAGMWPPGPGEFPDDGPDGGGTAGVREPRRPLPRSPQGAAELPPD